MFALDFDTSDIDRKLKVLQMKSPAAFQTALEKAAIQLLTWSVNGSAKESRTPPIRVGFLRGSGSAFVGSKHIGNTSGFQTEPGNGPNESYSAPKFEITLGYNAEYATKMHEELEPEGKYKKGKYTLQAGDAGPKWLEKHLSADKNAFMEMVASEFGKGCGML